jgi:hypothetical protein
MGYLKDFEISKYKGIESTCADNKLSLYFCYIVVLFDFLNIKSVKIYNENTFADGNLLCNRLQASLIIF